MVLQSWDSSIHFCPAAGVTFPNLRKYNPKVFPVPDLTSVGLRDCLRDASLTGARLITKIRGRTRAPDLSQSAPRSAHIEMSTETEETRFPNQNQASTLRINRAVVRPP